MKTWQVAALCAIAVGLVALTFGLCVSPQLLVLMLWAMLAVWSALRLMHGEVSEPTNSKLERFMSLVIGGLGCMLFELAGRGIYERTGLTVDHRHLDCMVAWLLVILALNSRDRC